VLATAFGRRVSVKGLEPSQTGWHRETYGAGELRKFPNDRSGGEWGKDGPAQSRVTKIATRLTVQHPSRWRTIPPPALGQPDERPMSSIPPEKPNRIMPQSPPGVRPPRRPKFVPSLPESEPCAPDIDEPDRAPEEAPWLPDDAGDVR